jgi:squalene-hopene/tetraprenyl-beta-curcumene cyclase
MGGAGMCNSYTKFYLAALGIISWDELPAVPPEIVLLPRWFYINMYQFSSWSRTFVVPLSIIWAHKPLVPLPPSKGIRELILDAPKVPNRGIGLLTWRRFFTIIDKLLKLVERKHMLPWRKKALKAAEEWMLARFERSSGLGAIFPPMVYALIALRCLGYPDDHPQVVRAWKELSDLRIEDDETLRIQPCMSPVWDTAIVVNALSVAGMSSTAPELIKAIDWLISKEVRQPGDWSLSHPDVEPAGWYFEYENEFYPDIDDTAMVLLALKRISPESCPGIKPAMDRGLHWLMAMQGKDGGWASFDSDNNRRIFCEIPFADHNAMIDPSTADIAGRILEMLAAYGYDQTDPRVKRAIRFLRREQEPDGSWFGRWGVNYVYGTWQVLKGLTAIGLPPIDDAVSRGASWLIQHQHDDGRWGETCSTYECPDDRGRGPSTASQTSWALMGLMSAGLGAGEAVQKGIDYLLRTQNSDGTWDEDDWTGTGFPTVFYLRYHLYRHSFPLWALGMYRQFLQERGVGKSEIGSRRSYK